MLGELVHTTDGKWMTRGPERCPNGHPLGPNQVLVGHVACLGHGGGGHTSWHCRTCDAVVDGPPLNTHCHTLDGPAVVRISNATTQQIQGVFLERQFYLPNQMCFSLAHRIR